MLKPMLHKPHPLLRPRQPHHHPHRNANHLATALRTRQPLPASACRLLRHRQCIPFPRHRALPLRGSCSMSTADKRQYLVSISITKVCRSIFSSDVGALCGSLDTTSQIDCEFIWFSTRWTVETEKCCLFRYLIVQEFPFRCVNFVFLCRRKTCRRGETGEVVEDNSVERSSNSGIS